MKDVRAALALALALTGCTGVEGSSEGERVVRQQLPPSDGPDGEVCLPQGEVPSPGAAPVVTYDCTTVPPSARLPLPAATARP